MIRPQLSLDLHAELIVDNFAGGGGASTGIELALGRHVDHAINHDRHALGMHRINHPQTVHHCEDVFDVDPAVVCHGRPIGFAHFSPDCKHFSKAKGGKPLDKKIRGLALVMLRYAKYGARVMTMENVEEIQTWGPLVRVKKNGAWGMYPDPEHKGRTWRAFLNILSGGVAADHPDLPEILEVIDGTVTLEDCVRGFGYDYQPRVIRACTLGSPTIRKRLYMVARRDGLPIVWPAPTHFDPNAGRLQRGQLAWRTIASCIDWDRPCPSIFLTRSEAKAAGFNCQRPLKNPTLRRIAKGVDRYVLKAAKPFLVSVTHQGGDRMESADDPARTVTGAHRGEKAVVAPTVTRFNGDHSGREDGAARNQPVDQPITVQDTSNRFGLCEAELAPFVTECANASTQRNFAADEPARTICGEVKGGHFAVVAPTVVNTANSKTSGRGPNGWSVEEPARTVTASPGFAVVSANLMVNNSHHTGAAVDGPAPTIPTGGHHAVVTGTLIGAGGRAAQSRLRGVDEPIHTVTAKGDSCVAAAYLAQHNGGFSENPGHPATEPISTISSTGAQQTVVTGSLAAYYGTAEDGQGVSEPARTVTAKQRFAFVESTGVHPMTPEQIFGARRVAAFLRSFGVEFQGEFATVAGYVIVDLGMRMLTPRELFRAQGFGDGYIIDRAWIIDPATGEVTEVHLTKEQQIRMCGNSVCPQVMEAIVRANVPELAAWNRGERPVPRSSAKRNQLAGGVA